MPTIQEYYEDSTNHGSYQYVTLDTIVDDLIEDGLDEDSFLKNTRRSTIIKHVKKGIRMMNFNVLNQPKILELEIGDALSVIMPADYTDYIRISVIGDDGYLYLLGRNDNIHIGKTYLQSHNYEILFAEDGTPLEADSSNAYSKPFIKREFHSSCINDTFNQDTSHFSINGQFRVDKERGVIALSSDLQGKSIVLEYVADGLEDEKIYNGKLKIHKHIADAISDYAYWQIIRKKRNVIQGEKQAARHEYFNSRREAKKRVSSVKVHEILKAMTATSKWI